jgi:hypothetical protein
MQVLFYLGAVVSRRALCFLRPSKSTRITERLWTLWTFSPLGGIVPSTRSTDTSL